MAKRKDTGLSPAQRNQLIQAVHHFAYCVMDSTKSEGINTRKNNAERRAAAALLDTIGVNHPTADEIDACIPG